jgi:adenylosuccinate synthase
VPLTVVVGGQYGSEGKGKLVSHLVCGEAGPVAAVRCGGSNAGHTAEGCGRRLLLRQLPSGAVDDRCDLFLSGGMQLDLGLLFDEIARCAVSPERLRVDPGAVLIEALDERTERESGLYARIASTLTGTGAAAARKVLRSDDVRRAADVPDLAPYLADVASRVNDLLDQGAHVILEGTQGYGLSLHHGDFPHVTSRDTTAAAFLSETGLAPSLVTEVVLVLRTYPIRVGGPSGPLRGELRWDDVAERAGYPTALAEYTTVTGRLRRVAAFDWDLAKRAVRANRPAALALHGLDYVDYNDYGVTRLELLGQKSRNFIQQVEARLGVPVRWLFTGPDGAHLIDRGPEVRGRSSTAWTVTQA